MLEIIKKIFRKKEVIPSSGSYGFSVYADSPFRAPHCDELVLHSPGKCEFCDKLPELQKLRVQWQINFTGESRKGFRKCPAELRRNLETINRWGGNVAQKKDAEKK